MSKRYTSQSGSNSGGKKFNNTHIHNLLRNVTYIGKIKYQDVIFDGEHEAIISPDIFEEAQKMLAENRNGKKTNFQKDYYPLLNGLLHCASCKRPMFHTYTISKSKRYNYYVCAFANRGGYKSCPTKSIKADLLESFVFESLTSISESQSDLILSRFIKAKDLFFPQMKQQVLKKIIKSVEISVEENLCHIETNDNRHEFYFDTALLTQTNKQKKFKIPKIRQSLIQAYKIKEAYETTKSKTSVDLSKHLGISKTRINHLLSLHYLSPRIKEEILLSTDNKLFKLKEKQLIDLAKKPLWKKQEHTWLSLKTRFINVVNNSSI